MAGRGPAPSEKRRRSNAPERGDWELPAGIGWQHGTVPRPPDGLLAASKRAWSTWMAAWFASHWGPEDLPALRQLIRLYDQVERGEYQRHGELRLGMDTYGITPKGQQDRRWARPRTDEEAKVSAPPEPTSAYGHLRAVPNG